ncbi:NASP-related protein sim3 [Punica granatum]|uniref:Uncharacterized protein n=2 Tax=Punica granatum TaxID=22663 RepID=A0A218W1Y0_PUNGR|nr:NASP-related protein sim3 [Punica granatum]OWM66320.1 hypothetical protein CDL15_Pgr013537 [Punica granatum]PKI36164.1 hypothetical protein CRG98_043463 [Punica granatum]
MAGKEEAAPTSKASAAAPQSSTDAVIESSNLVGGGAESTCNDFNNNMSSGCNAESSAVTSDGGKGEKPPLELADELVERGSKALKDGDFAEATDCFSRALEIRVARYGELAPECVNAYYKYGCALLYKAQEEADPLGNVPKKDAESQEGSTKGGSAKNNVNGESSTASVSSTAVQVPLPESDNQGGIVEDGASGEKDQEEDDEDSEAEDIAEADEDESDLDLAWKMLDIARAIVEKHFGDTMEKVDILSALAEVALEREDIETSLSDYQRALSTLEKLVEQDDRQIAELNFRICLCLEIGSKPSEAIPYCQKAISICKSRVQRLMDEVKSSSEPVPSSDTSVSDGGVIESSSGSLSNKSSADKEAEIETLNGLTIELEKKLEDLQQVASNPTSVLTEILGMVSAKAKEMEKKASSAATGSSQMGANMSGDFDSPTVSTAHTSGPAGVTHLGVVGRGVKRVTMSSGAAESNPQKRPSLESSSDKQDGSAS